MILKKRYKIFRKRRNRRSDEVYFSYLVYYSFYRATNFIEACSENKKIKLPNDAYFPFIFTRHTRQTLLRNGRGPNLQFSRKYTQYMKQQRRNRLCNASYISFKSFLSIIRAQFITTASQFFLTSSRTPREPPLF